MRRSYRAADRFKRVSIHAVHRAIANSIRHVDAAADAMPKIFPVKYATMREPAETARKIAARSECRFVAVNLVDRICQ